MSSMNWQFSWHDPSRAAEHRERGSASQWRGWRRHSGPLRIETGALAGAVALQRHLVADRVRAIENPVLPRAEPAEDLRIHRLRPGGAQIGFKTGQRVRR